MKAIGKIAGYNLLAILIYTILVRLAAGRGSEAGLGIILLMALAVGIHVVVCILVSIGMYSANKKEMGRAWLLGSGIVLIVGFSACLGAATL